MKNNILIVFLYFFLLNNLISQPNQKDAIINENVTFTVIMTNYWKSEDTYSRLKKNLIRLKNFNYKIKDYEYKEIMNLINGLDNENTDWVCNLILYQLTNREGIILFSLGTSYINLKTGFIESENELIQMWRDSYKEEEKKYWLNWLNKKYYLERV